MTSTLRFLARLRAALALCLAVCLWAACVPNRKVIYFQSPDFAVDRPVQLSTQRQEYTLQVNDVLSVQILNTDRQTSQFYNLTDPGGMGMGMVTESTMYINGYSVDNAGNIQLPMVGNVAVKGLTVNQAGEALRAKVSEYVKNATVNVKLVSFRVAVLGEVHRPGHFHIYNNQATVLEALAMAGDMRNYANRKRVKLVRQNPAGTEVVLLDLTSPDLVMSKFYYLQPNDALYVEPLRAQASRENINLLGTFFAGISTLALILNFFQIKP